MRFIYCACCISFLLKDWSGINKSLALDFINKSKNYDGAYAQIPGQESHGGSTYCAIASLKLMGYLDDECLKSHENTLVWLLNRQTIGFQGRVNKPEDSCYSFWIGASLDVRFFIDKIVQIFELNLWPRYLELPNS